MPAIVAKKDSSTPKKQISDGTATHNIQSQGSNYRRTASSNASKSVTGSGSKLPSNRDIASTMQMNLKESTPSFEDYAPGRPSKKRLRAPLRGNSSQSDAVTSPSQSREPTIRSSLANAQKRQSMEEIISNSAAGRQSKERVTIPDELSTTMKDDTSRLDEKMGWNSMQDNPLSESTKMMFKVAGLESAQADVSQQDLSSPRRLVAATPNQI